MKKLSHLLEINRQWAKGRMLAAAFLLFLTIFSTGHSIKNTDAFGSWPLASAPSDSLTCQVTKMEVSYQSGADNNGTEPAWEDDFYLANFKVYHEGEKIGDSLEVTHPSLLLGPASVAITSLSISNGYTHLFSNKMRTAINTKRAVPGWVALGTFTVKFKDGDTGEILCTKNFTFNKTSRPNERHVRPCSVCTADGGAWNKKYPGCWPDELTADPCDDPLNHAPDPNFPQLTPERWVKVILHIFQKEHPDSLGKYKPHPTDPGNYSSEHIGLFKSWFNDPGGVNDFMANLCESSNGTSPHIADSKIRFLLEHGEEGNDIFFHPDNRRWGIGYYPCGKNKCGQKETYRNSQGAAQAAYVTGGGSGSYFAPFLPQWYMDTISAPERQNAMHVFLSRGTWKDLNRDGKPDENVNDTCAVDCFNFWPGGYTIPNEVNCNGDKPQSSPTQYLYGNYEAYLYLTDTNYAGRYKPTVAAPDSVVELGTQITGEFFHVLSVDHPSPFQAHYHHELGGDGCLDTDGSSSGNNMLGCNFEKRCALSQCQIGRMHRYFSELQPAIERFPDGKGGWSLTPQYCSITEPDILIAAGADILWAGPKTLRSNIVVKSGGKLTITCDMGMPENGRITVQPGGQLFVQDAKIYSNCVGTLWHGIIVDDASDDGNPSGFCKLINATIENARTGVK